MTERSLAGKVALVTGTTSGLGRRFAMTLARAGAAVAVAGRRADRLKALRGEIEAEGGKALELPLDVMDEGAILAGVDAAEKGLGPIDILVNNAGISGNQDILSLPTEEFDRLMATNVRAPYILAREVARRMIAREAPEGRIINIASIIAYRIAPGLTPYSMSKTAVINMTKGMAREWARHRINVNAICPGYIRTEMNSEFFDSPRGLERMKDFPRRRIGDPEHLDGLLLFLAGPESEFVTGDAIVADDGQLLS